MKTNPDTAKCNQLTIFSDMYLEGRNQPQWLGRLPLPSLTSADKQSCQRHYGAAPGAAPAAYLSCLHFCEILAANVTAHLLSGRFYFIYLFIFNQDTYDSHRSANVLFCLFLINNYRENDRNKCNLCGQANALWCSYVMRQAQHLHVLKEERSRVIMLKRMRTRLSPFSTIPLHCQGQAHFHTAGNIN